jgi:hypothetical protein
MVSPAAGLFDDQEVLVTVNGFGIGGKVWLSQCASGSNANDQGCGSGLPEQMLLVTDDNGAGWVDFPVQTSAANQPNNLTNLDPCVDTCVLVATEGDGYRFAIASLNFDDSAPPNCTTSQLSVSVGKIGAATGHAGFPLLFSNASSQECLLSGYPGVSLLNADDQQVAQAQREPSGFLGGLPGYSGGPLPAIGLEPRQTASALVEGQDFPQAGVTACGPFPAILVTPPNAVQSVRLDVAPACSPFSVHPVVLGDTGEGAQDF